MPDTWPAITIWITAGTTYINDTKCVTNITKHFLDILNNYQLKYV